MKKQDFKFIKDYFPVNIIPNVYKDYFKPNFQGEYTFPGFKTIHYSSLKNKISNFSQ